jgi:cytochrome c oxidase subunit 1
VTSVVSESQSLASLEPSDLRNAKSLTLAYVLTATAVFFVSGMLGVLLRNSQTSPDLGRLSDNTWYAVMTAHGLGAFVGWAAFAVMGFSFWVLASHGFPVRRFGRGMAWFAYWCMVFGVAGIVVSTLVMHFAGSWVFLYPLPFNSVGQWGDAATALFLFSVLLAGLSIITWCIAILNTIVGPALHAVRSGFLNRLGVGVGFGYLWPKRFATSPRSVPYPLIPLTVIGIDMIIATLPLAVLLIVMIAEVFEPGVNIDVLGAKNILWFFGHPVVYLLLFPAAAVYYHLIPRFAGRPLVAGRVIAVAWGIAVLANVLVWAHHVYLDYPTTLQTAVNTAMQPLTFALVIPSALSLYSLGFTIYRSSFVWTGASTALFLGLVSWLLSGLSGIVNATIAFQETIHNSLWIVGHFHHMAFYNIGFLIFGATYAYLPELTGKRLYSDRMAKAHIWITFVAGMGFVTTWLVEGLEGAPRRFAVLPETWNAYQVASIPFIFAIALAQLLFAWNVVQTVRGKGGLLNEPAPVVSRRERRRRMELASYEAAFLLVALGLVFAAGVGGFFIGRGTADEPAPPASTEPSETEPAPPATETEPSTTEPAPPADDGGGNAAAGAEVFASAGCGSCHTLTAAGASGTIGPNLDGTTLDVAGVADVVANGRAAMPPFSGQLDEQQIADVAAFIAESAGG